MSYDSGKGCLVHNEKVVTSLTVHEARVGLIIEFFFTGL